MVVWSESQPLVVPACDRADFRLFHAAPRLSNGWALLGETTKWVPTSKARFLRVDVVSHGDDDGHDDDCGAGRIPGGPAHVGGAHGSGGGSGSNFSSAVYAHVVGAAGEEVVVSFADAQGVVYVVPCVVGDSLRAVVGNDGSCRAE